jgi:hypothetical protein
VASPLSEPNALDGASGVAASGFGFAFGFGFGFGFDGLFLSATCHPLHQFRP